MIHSIDKVASLLGGRVRPGTDDVLELRPAGTKGRWVAIQLPGGRLSHEQASHLARTLGLDPEQAVFEAERGSWGVVFERADGKPIEIENSYLYLYDGRAERDAYDDPQEVAWFGGY